MKKLLCIATTILLCTASIFAGEEESWKKREFHFLKDKSFVVGGGVDFLENSSDYYSKVENMYGSEDFTMDMFNWEAYATYRVSLTKHLYAGLTGGYIQVNVNNTVEDNRDPSYVYGIDDDKYMDYEIGDSINIPWYAMGQLGIKYDFLSLIPNYFYVEAGYFCGEKAFGLGWTMKFIMDFGYSCTYCPDLDRYMDRFTVGFDFNL